MARRIIIHNHLPRRARDVNAFEHAVSKETEEKNRDKLYRDAGITRVRKRKAFDASSENRITHRGEELQRPINKEAEAKRKVAREKQLKESEKQMAAWKARQGKS
jgi:hypothetical protein